MAKGFWKQMSDAAYYGSKEDKAAGRSSFDNLGLGIDNRFARPFYSAEARTNAGKEEFVPSAMDDSAGYEEYLSSGVSEDMNPREFAKTFDPTSNTDVMKMQGMLGVKEDGILGPKTLKSLRALQGVPYDSPEVGFSEESQWADEPGYGDKFGVMEDEYGDMVSYGAPAQASPEARGPKLPGVKGWLQRLFPGGQSGYGDPNAPTSSPEEISDFNYQGGNSSSEPRLQRKSIDDMLMSQGESSMYDDPYGASEELLGLPASFNNPSRNAGSFGQGFNPSSRADAILRQFNNSKRFTNKY